MLKVKDFLKKYPAVVHFAMLFWNAFLISWATKVKVPLAELGVPITIDATKVIDTLQLHFHIPTFVIGLLGLCANLIVGYNNWHKKENQ